MKSANIESHCAPSSQSTNLYAVADFSAEKNPTPYFNFTVEEREYETFFEVKPKDARSAFSEE
jgi:hypothetical protein